MRVGICSDECNTEGPVGGDRFSYGLRDVDGAVFHNGKKMKLLNNIENKVKKLEKELLFLCSSFTDPNKEEEEEAKREKEKEKKKKGKNDVLPHSYACSFGPGDVIGVFLHLPLISLYQPKSSLSSFSRGHSPSSSNSPPPVSFASPALSFFTPSDSGGGGGGPIAASAAGPVLSGNVPQHPIVEREKELCDLFNVVQSFFTPYAVGSKRPTVSFPGSFLCFFINGECCGGFAKRSLSSSSVVVWISACVIQLWSSFQLPSCQSSPPGKCTGDWKILQ